MMEEQRLLNPLAITHLLQHTLRSLCIHENSHWLYAVFWRILPRNFPPPIWDLHGSAYDTARGNRRNWILVWEDGFCNFATSALDPDCPSSSSAVTEPQRAKGLEPELFFKMSHEIYNYGEGLIGKVAADHGHKWVYKESQSQDQEINFLTTWSNPSDSQPRTWKAQFQSGIKTIALIAVREGVVQLGAVNKVMEDFSFVVLLRNKFAYLESIPGVLLPHPSPAIPIGIDCCGPPVTDSWAMPLPGVTLASAAAPPPIELFDHLNHQMRITPSMSSLEALLAKLPSVGPVQPVRPPSLGCYENPVMVEVTQRPVMIRGEGLAKEEVEEHDGAGESSSSMPYAYYTNVRKSTEEF